MGECVADLAVERDPIAVKRWISDDNNNLLQSTILSYFELTD